MEATTPTQPDPQETTEFDAMAENGEPVEERLLAYLTRYADARGEEHTNALLIRWRCDRSGHDFEVMVSNDEPEMVICGRCGLQWSVVS